MKRPQRRAAATAESSGLSTLLVTANSRKRRILNNVRGFPSVCNLLLDCCSCSAENTAVLLDLRGPLIIQRAVITGMN